jgi:hypothetical protein
MLKLVCTDIDMLPAASAASPTERMIPKPSAQLILT